MRAFVQTAVGAFEERDLPPPRPARGEVVVRVRAALTCGTDVKLWKRGHPKIALPVTMGHEAAGEIAELGAHVDGFRVGDRVVPGVSGPCGVCAECRRGLENLCAIGHSDRAWGAFAEAMRIPAGVVARNLHRVPDDLPDEVAAFLDPLASVLHGWNRLGPVHGRVLVYGAGALGLLWAATARLRGLRTIVAARSPAGEAGAGPAGEAGKGRPERVAAARRLGADVLDVDRETPEEALASAPPEVAVDATGDPDVWARLPSLVAPGGRVLLFGGCPPGATVAWDAARLHYGEVSLVGSFHYTPAEAREAMRLLASREIDPTPLLSDRGGLSDLPRFLAAQARGEGIRYAVLAADEESRR